MPRPIFDIDEYELRGSEPVAFTEEQSLRINKTTSRIHGQIDWTAQLLGFNGPNYWGRSNPKEDFSYNWVGLVETMNEKRQMQTGAFGVYAKNEDYSVWPAPFNRRDIKASGDYSFHIWDDEVHTYVRPLGYKKSPSYMDDPVLIVGGSYIFDGVVEFLPHSGGDQSDEEPSIFVETIYNGGVWTRLRILRYMTGALEVKIKGSNANALPFEVIRWEDISDWNHPEVYKQFLGIWGNKGNNISFDFAFDALSLHGADEHYSLFMEPKIQSYTVQGLLEKFGLEPTPWTGHHPEKFTFYVAGCEDPLVPQAPVLGNGVGNPALDKYWPPTLLGEREEMGECLGSCDTYVKAWQTLHDKLYDNGVFDAICPPPTYINYDNDQFVNNPLPETLLDDYEYHGEEPKGNVKEGFYNRHPEPPYPTDCDEPPFNYPDEFLDNGTFENLVVDFIFESADEGIYDRNPYSGILGFEFTWEALTPGAILNGVCISWLFDPTLDNGTLEESIHRLFPPLDPLADEWLYDEGAWATANGGIFDTQDTSCNTDLYSSLDAPCTNNEVWCGFDDGEYDETDEYCECETFDQADTSQCYIDPCTVPDLDCDADGGILTIYGPPNYQEECECVVDCCLVDNEEIPPPPPYLGPDVISGDIYDRYCKPQLNPPPEIELCPVKPVLVELVEITENITLSMLPSVRNALTPLRLWKNHTLMVTDEVPAKEGIEEYRNFLVADSNRGPEPEASYRHFVRLPLEYKREGKEWTRAVQICKNQSYFSSPNNLSNTKFEKEDAAPTIYCEEYRNKPKPTVAIYDESFFHSSITEDFEQTGSGFEDSVIAVVDSKPLPYSYSSIEDYDALASRNPDKDGEWRGKYYTLGEKENLSGHLTQDLSRGSLIELDYSPVYDESPVKRVDTTFAKDLPKVKMKNYVVSYAYFMADLSACEEPTFEPSVSYCWRNPLIDNDTTIDGECVFTPIESNTAYLLHPQEIDYGKRTRDPREPGELTRAAETSFGFFERI